MRIGQNPAKFVESVPRPERVTAVVITYIPFLGGYYEQSLDVLKVCLASMRANTAVPFDLLVFDNASCREVREYLQGEHSAGNVQYLVLSQENLGKVGAWNFAFAAAPGEIIAYADSDVYFEMSWLENLAGVLDRYPEAGMVTGMPMWSPEVFSTATTAWAERTAGVTLKRGKSLAWEDYWKHARSLGQDEVEAKANFDRQSDLVLEDARTTPAGRFFIGAGHFQFVAWKSILNRLIPLEADKPMGQVRRLDEAINEAAYLRLSTPEWWIRHLGNTLDGTEPFPDTAAAPAKKPRLRGPLRALVHWVYHRAFDLLYRS